MKLFLFIAAISLLLSCSASHKAQTSYPSQQPSSDQVVVSASVSHISQENMDAVVVTLSQAATQKTYVVTDITSASGADLGTHTAIIDAGQDRGYVNTPDATSGQPSVKIVNVSPDWANFAIQ